MNINADDIFKNGPLIKLFGYKHLADDMEATLEAIPLSAWPMQHATCCRPAMVNDPSWPGKPATSTPGVMTLGEMMRRLIETLAFCGLQQHVGHQSSDLDYRTPMLSPVMPSQDVAPHGDRQEDSWLGRLHLPITTNRHAEFRLGGESHHLERGVIYLLDVRKIHSSVNRGLSTRVHLMVDIHRRQP